MSRQRFTAGLAVVAAVVMLGAATAGAAATPTPGRSTVVRGAGWAISQGTIDHWIQVAAVSSSPVRRVPVIVPTDPPRFAGCVRSVRRKVPSLAHARPRILRKDCRAVFATLSTEALDFLIKAHWYEDLAGAEHIKISQRRVVRQFRRARREQFPTRAGFRKFLRQTGQTVADVLFRFRVNIAFTALLKRIHLSPAKALSRLEREVRRRYRPTTICARYYVISDCAHSRRHHHP